MTAEGTWSISIKIPIGERKAEVVLRADGTRLIAKERLLYDGTINGDVVSWKTDGTSPMALTLTFNGKVSGDTIAGKVNTALGKWAFSGIRAQQS